MAAIHPGFDRSSASGSSESPSAPVSAVARNPAGTGVARTPGRSRTSRIAVAIVGASGYVGGELIRLLERHPRVRLAGLVARGREREPVGAVHRHLDTTGLVLDDALPASDAVFLALPHGTAAALVPGIAAQGRLVVDLGPDFRLRDPADYPRWYGFEHPAPELLASAVYGLPELHRRELAELEGASPAIIGAPGCYPTATVLALAPLARAGLIADLVVDAKSGVSGAGREPKPDMLFGEVNESVRAYGIDGHRHVAEIEQELAAAAGSRATNPGAAAVDFLPHLVPMTRGILAACHVRPTRPVTQVELDALYRDAYADEPFVEVVGSAPATKHVLGSNTCRIFVRADERTGRVLAISVIDNLVKGAAGQAIQAFNLAYGLLETAGLDQLPLVP